MTSRIKVVTEMDYGSPSDFFWKDKLVNKINHNDFERKIRHNIMVS